MPKDPDSSFASFNYFESLFRNTKQNTVLLMDEKGIVTEINSAFSNSFGYLGKDIIGKNGSILFTDEDQKKGMPDKELASVLNTGQSSDNNYLVNKDKTVTWVSGESILVKNSKGTKCIMKLIQNIHQQKTSEKSLQKSLNLNERILGAIDDVVIVINTKLEIIITNKAFSKLFKGSNVNKAFTNFNDVIKKLEIKNDITEKILLALDTKTAFVDTELEMKSGANEKRMFELTCRTVEGFDNTTDLLLVLHDITIQKQIERQREDIIGFVAHELRNPLANIVLCNELLKGCIEEDQKKDALELLSRSQNNVMRLNKMIAELYDVTKAGSGNMQLENAVFNFEEMIKEALQTMKALQPLYKVKIKGKANFNVHGDKDRLIQVVTNYLSNAIKYSEGSDVVELTLTHDEKSVTVSVKDRGLGISKEQLPYIFNRFFRAEKTKNLEGVGLGLYLCRQIIKAHKGNVWAESKEYKGSVFYFSIPL